MRCEWQNNCKITHETEYHKFVGVQKVRRVQWGLQSMVVCHIRLSQLRQCILNYAEDVPGTLPELLSLEVSGGCMPTQTY